MELTEKFFESKDFDLMYSGEVTNVEPENRQSWREAKEIVGEHLQENIESSDLFIVFPINGELDSELQEKYGDLMVESDIHGETINGYVLRADGIAELLSDYDPEDMEVYECPDYIADSEENCPIVEYEDIKNEQIYDLFEFFELD